MTVNNSRPGRRVTRMYCPICCMIVDSFAIRLPDSFTDKQTDGYADEQV